jgi:hypothetical protein
VQHSDVAREKLFTMRMSAEEWARIEALGAHYALNAASLLRFLVKREADAIGVAARSGATPTKTKRAPSKRKAVRR